MWSRVVLKERAKVSLRRNYWKCVLVAFILTLVLEGGLSSNGNSSKSNQNSGYASENSFSIGDSFKYNFPLPETNNILVSVGQGILHFVYNGFAITLFLAGMLLEIFVFLPLEIGGCRFFTENAYQTSDPGRLLFPFKSGYYGKMVLTMFLRNLFVALWTLLLIIPGLIKTYEYRMVPYLLADCPEMSRQDAFAISKEMMNGQKMEAFILDLSFLGWKILSACTCGLVGIFYVYPYQYATNAELFLALKDEYFSRRNFSGSTI